MVTCLAVLAVVSVAGPLMPWTLAFAAGAEIGIPVINVGPGGKSDVEEDFQRQTDLLQKMGDRAAEHGVTLCCKAHVGASIYSTPTTRMAMEKITRPSQISMSSQSEMPRSVSV